MPALAAATTQGTENRLVMLLVIIILYLLGSMEISEGPKCSGVNEVSHHPMANTLIEFGISWPVSCQNSNLDFKKVIIAKKKKKKDPCNIFHKENTELRHLIAIGGVAFPSPVKPNACFYLFNDECF